MQHTSNYNLNKPDITDYAKIQALNENADIIDARLKELDSNKANSNSMTELQQRLTTHLDDMAKHNEFMQGAQKIRVVLGWNTTLNCPTMEYMEVV